MAAEPARKTLPPAFTVSLVVALFVVPILVAWWLAVMRPDLPAGELINRGLLLQPPLDINAEPAMAPLRALELAPGEWAMVYFAAGSCTEQCHATLAMLTTIRSVLGHDGTRVKVAALLDVAAASVPLHFAAPAARTRVSRVVSANRSDGPVDAGIVFLDWRGQIMLYFVDAHEPADIKKDLKRLLRGSKIN